MKSRIRICRECGRYTLKERCPICGGSTNVAHPAKFSPDDPYLDLKVKNLVEELRRIDP